MADAARRRAGGKTAPPRRDTATTARRPGRGRGRAGRRAGGAGRRPGRYAVVYDVDGPRVRLGIAWFVVSVAAVAASSFTAALVYGVACAAAAMQGARAWKRWPLTLDRRATGVIAAALVVAAAVHDVALGLALIGVAALAYYLGMVRGRVAPPAAASRLLELGLLPGLAGAGVVLTARHSTGAALALLVVVSAYEAGDFIVGSGAATWVEGPLAGAVAALVVSFSIGAIGVPPFELPGVLGYGLAAAVACPAGQLLASAILPTAGARAPALRRVDSLLLLAPLWAAFTLV